MRRLNRHLTSLAVLLSLARVAAAQTADDAAKPVAESPPPAVAPVVEAPRLPAPPAAELPPAAAAAPTTAPATDAGDVASELQDEQPGATDAILNGEALKIYGFGDINYRQFFLPKSSPWLVYL